MSATDDMTRPLYSRVIDGVEVQNHPIGWFVIDDDGTPWLLADVVENALPLVSDVGYDEVADVVRSHWTGYSGWDGYWTAQE